MWLFANLVEIIMLLKNQCILFGTGTVAVYLLLLPIVQAKSLFV